MGVTQNLFWVLLHLILLFHSHSIKAQPSDYPIITQSTSWANSPTITRSVRFTDGSIVRPLLLRGNSGPTYACGFYCSGTCQFYVFAVFIVQTNSASNIIFPGTGFPQVVWSANRNNPVKENATLLLNGEGNLILRDADGSLIWSTDTTGKSVSGLNMTETGNLVLFDRDNATVWASFDHPTDSLVFGQKLVERQRLTASVSALNWTEGPFSLSVTSEGLFAFIDSNPPQSYYQAVFSETKTSQAPSYVKFINGSLAMYISSAEPEPQNGDIGVPLSASAASQYMKLDPDGHLRLYSWLSGWTMAADLLMGYVGECHFPLVCGNYGICSKGKCNCPGATSNDKKYFRQKNDRQPNLGCSEITPLSCQGSQHHSFLELEDTFYFTFSSDLVDVDSDSCKQACLKNCSCKAALFQYVGNSSNGNCSLPTQLFSLSKDRKENYPYNSTAFIKVQTASSEASPVPVGTPASTERPPSSTDSPIPVTPSKKTGRMGTILGSSLGASFVMLLAISIWVVRIRKKGDAEGDEEDYLDHVPGMPTRFSCDDLKAATENFNRKLGEGGFGSVFEGTLADGTKVAVKRLDGLGQVKKSFLAEVESIGSIHHVNLVRLIGFCAEKSERLLVYEYMHNGSLDNWVFHKNQEPALNWETRRKIIHDIAKGLAYLHEDCRQKIVHLDIKPQNILLDDNFCAKVSDFGLSKLIDRDKSRFMTTMRGTPGYLAPEWLSSAITEKVDVYSFGIVVMEILCGRKNVDCSQPEEAIHLLGLFKRKVEENKLRDIIDRSSEDMELHEAEVMEMMKVAAWCVKSDFARRPSMSVVVKVLEGAMNVESNIDYNFWTPPVTVTELGASAQSPSVLSGPR